MSLIVCLCLHMHALPCLSVKVPGGNQWRIAVPLNPWSPCLWIFYLIISFFQMKSYSEVLSNCIFLGLLFKPLNPFSVSSPPPTLYIHHTLYLPTPLPSAPSFALPSPLLFSLSTAFLFFSNFLKKDLFQKEREGRAERSGGDMERES